MVRRNSVVIGCLAALALASCGGGGVVNVSVGTKAPALRLESLDGETVSLESFRGTPVVLTFWATWCQPCIREIPVLKSVESLSLAKVVAVSLDDEGESVVRPFVEQRDLTYAVLLGDPEVFMRFGGLGIPYTILMDEAGVVTKIYSGTIELETIEADLKTSAAAS